MSRTKNAGRWVKVIQGIHTDKTGIAYHRDQLPEIQAAGKIAVTLEVPGLQSALFEGMQETEVKPVLFDPSFLKLIGFVD